MQRIFLVTILLIPLITNAQNKDYEKWVFHQELNARKEVIATNKTEFDIKTKDKTSLQKELSGLSADLSKKQNKLSGNRLKITDLESTIAEVDNELKIIKEKLKLQQSNLEKKKEELKTAEAYLEKIHQLLNEKQEKLLGVTERSVKITKNLQDKKSKRDEIAASLKEETQKFDAVKERLRELDQLLDDLNDNLVATTEEMMKATANNEEDLLEELKEKKKKQEATKEEYINEAKKIKQELPALEAEITSLRNQKEIRDQEVAQMQADYEEITIQHDDIKNQVSMLEEDRDSQKQKIEDIRKNVEEIEKQVTDLELQVNTENTKKGKAEKEKRYLQDENEVLIQEITHLEEEIENTNKKIASLTKRLDEIENKASDQLLKGIQLAKDEKLKESIDVFQEALDKEPDLFDTRYLLTYTKYIHKPTYELLSKVEKAIELKPKYPSTYVLRARIYKLDKNYITAKKSCDKAINFDTDHADAHAYRAFLYYNYLNENILACEDLIISFQEGNLYARESKDEVCSNPERETYVISQITQTTYDTSYSTLSNPVMVGKSKDGKYANAEKYLSLLRDAKGNEVEFFRLGNCCPYETKNGVNGKALIEKYRVTFKNKEGKKETKIYYISVYDYEHPKIPVNMKTTHEIY